MKKITLCFFILGLALIGQAQVSKTINITTAGGLSTALTSTEKSTVTNLTITGTIDARDFVTMRDAMPVLTNIDLSGTIITYYSGSAGPYGVKAFLSPAIKTSAKTGLDDPLNRIRAQQIKKQVGTVVTTAYPANEIPQFAFCNPNTYNGKASLKSVIMPSSVTSIGYDAFANCSGLTSVTIPSSVTFIGDEAFAGCSGLTSVSIPSSVTTIGIYAFVDCSGLTSINVETTNQNYSGVNGVLFDKNQINLIQYPGGKTGSYTIPSSVTSIGDDAFANCSGLTSVTIPSSVTSIGSQAFYSCSGLTSITIPSSVTSIEVGAFCYCSSLTSVTIPSSVTTIGVYAFVDCSGLTSINVETTNQNYSGVNGVLFNKNQSTLFQYPNGKTGVSYSIPATVSSIGDYAFFDCYSLTSVTIPSSVTSIGIDAFYFCSGLTSISIPSSVTTIGEYAFYKCSSLTSIYAYPATPVDLTSSTNVFSYVNKTTCTLYVPTGSKALYRAADKWKLFVNIVEFATAVPALFDGGSIQIYPNPVTDDFRIKGIEGTSEIRLTDLNGKVLLQKQVVGNENVSVSTLSKGMYIVKIIITEGTVERKLVKK